MAREPPTPPKPQASLTRRAWANWVKPMGFGARPAAAKPNKNPLLGFEDEHGEIFYRYKGERNGLQVLEEMRCTGKGILVEK